MMQNQLPPDLASAIQALNAVNPAPNTVVGQLKSGVEQAYAAQAGMTPTQDAAYMGQNAMQQDMRDQEQMKAVVERMAQAQQPQGGIAGLPMLSDGGDYAEGGIVGFSGSDRSDVESKPKTQEERDREGMLDTLKRMAAAGYDIATLPGRAALGVLESGVTRPLRALGVPIPYLPESVYGGNRGSMTPYYDRLREEVPQTPVADYSNEGRNYPSPIVRQEQPQPQPQGQGQAVRTGVSNQGIAALPGRGKLDAALAAMQNAYSGMSAVDPSSQDILRRVQDEDAARRELLRSRGIDPDYEVKEMQRLAKQGEEEKAYWAQLKKDYESQRGPYQSFIDFALNAQGMRGQGIGATMASGARGMQRADEARVQNARAAQEKIFEIQKLTAEKQFLLAQSRDKIARGDFEGAQKDIIEARKRENEIRKAQGEGAGKAVTAETSAYGTDVQAAVQKRGQDLTYAASMNRNAAPRQIYDTINDNVQRRLDAWAKTPSGLAETMKGGVGAVSAKRQEFLLQAINEAKALGMPVPPDAIKLLSTGTSAPSASNVDLSQWGNLQVR